MDEEKLLKEIQDGLNSSTPLIGSYIATASAICTLAMAADVMNGFRSKKFWFPCKYFPLNAATLTLLAVSAKLPMDLTTDMFTNTDWQGKLSSLIFMSTAMVHFSSSLGSMKDKEILMNVAALGILVITLNANVWIQLKVLEGYATRDSRTVLLAATILLLVLFLALVSSAIMVPTAKRLVESKYQEMHKVVLMEEQLVGTEPTHDRNRGRVKKYWVMVETGNPQFVVARSVVSVASSATCFVVAVTMVNYNFSDSSSRAISGLNQAYKSSYGRSITCTIIIQFAGVLLGTISGAVKWIVFAHSKCSENTERSFKREFEIEAFWIQRLEDWRDSMLSLHARHQRCGKCLHAAKVWILNFCIRVQIFIVLSGKLLVFISAQHLSILLRCLKCIKKLKAQNPFGVSTSNDHIESESGDGTEQDLSRYVLLIEGEAKLPEVTLKRISKQADKIIQTGKKKKPENLIELLRKSANFRGVVEFDQFNLHGQDPPNCWTLPLVTLTSIAVALPNIETRKTEQLLRSVREGMALAKLVEKTLITKELLNIRKAAEVTWAGVVLQRKWQDINLLKKSIERIDSKEIIKELYTKAESILREFNTQGNGLDMENPLKWPLGAIAAHSMYRVTHTILLFEGENEETNQELFERLSVMITDILAACLSNLQSAITTKYHRNAIEKREKNMQKAVLLLGQTEDIIELLQQFELPSSSLGPGKAVYINEWRNVLNQQHG